MSDVDTTGLDRIVCDVVGHEWKDVGPMYSDGWKRECQRCGKTGSVTR